MSGRDRQCGHSWDCCSLPRPESLPLLPSPASVFPPLLSRPCASTTQKASPFLSLSTVSHLCAFITPVPWSGHPSASASAVSSQHQGNATLTGPSLCSHASSQQPGRLALAFPRAVHYLDSPILQGLLSTKWLHFCSAPSLQWHCSSLLCSSGKNKGIRRGAWSPLRSLAPWPLGCPGERGTFQSAT